MRALDWFGLVWFVLGPPPHDRDGLISGRFAPRPRMQGPDARLPVGCCYVWIWCGIKAVMCK